MKFIPYTLENLFWAVVSIIMYRSLIYRCIPGVDSETSLMILAAVLAGNILLGYLLHIDIMSSDMDVFINVASGYGIYTMMAYKDTPIKAFKLALVIGLTLSAAACAAVLFRRLRRKRRKAAIRNRIHACLTFTRVITELCIAVVMVAVAFGSLFGLSATKRSIEPAGTEAVENYTIKEHMDTVLKLREAVWEKLSEEEKLDVMQVIANIEVHYLGIPHTVSVTTGLMSEHLYGRYDEAGHVIGINLEHLMGDSAESVLDTVCHEVYHAYQNSQCAAYESVPDEYRGLYMFKDLEQYRAEIEDYNDGSEDFMAYYTQKIEANARAYAESAAADYMHRIDSYLSEV